MAKKKNPLSIVKVGNALTQGNGGNTLQDRGAIQQTANFSFNPYFNNNYFYRWQAFCALYYTSWEAKKIVDIPVDDAFRIKPNLVGLNEQQKVKVLNECDKLHVFEKMKRAAIQERLLGGCAILLGLADKEDEPEKPIDPSKIDKGDLKFLNIITLNQLNNPQYNTDPFSPEYDKPEYYDVNGIKTHVSRLIIFDGNPLFNYTSQRLFQNFRINPQGFGESVLVPIWDAIQRCIGTQQAAYQLVMKSSVTLVKSENLLNLEGTKKGEEAVRMLEDMAAMISIYRAAIIKGKGVDIAESSASFGSVPEMVMTYLQTLSAASDIPASRFLGQAPGGLNATGEGDLENYYNMIAAYQEQSLDPKFEKLFDILGRSTLGTKEWDSVRKNFEIEFESLWNLDGTEKATVDQTYVTILRDLKADGIIPGEKVVEEINSRKIFNTELDEDDIQDLMEIPEEGIKEKTDAKFEELKNGGSDSKQKTEEASD